MDIYTLSIKENIDEATLTKWFSYLPPKRRERLNKFRFRGDFLRSLYGEVILRTIVGEKVGLLPKDIIITRPAGAKPFLSDHPDIHFSISHSGEWVVCAVSDNGVGIDIEEIKVKRVKPSLIKRVLTDKEQEYMKAFLDEENTKHATLFYQYWTLKEAYSKCIGLGLGIDFRKIEIDISGQEITLTDNSKKWDGMLKSADFQRGYSLALCTEKPENYKYVPFSH